ncbi:MAG: PEPxxWA-CTERM sorting domain-containing protein [Caulobacteraceae bacterium]|nr:PEPxxWA-CTERM sorting domain-containing protein [Caulobacteraceae bacterium]
MKATALLSLTMAGALLGGGSASAAAKFFDYVKVVVPGNDTVTFETFNENTESFVGLTGTPLVFIPGTIYLTEPGTSAISDVLSILPATNGSVNIFFVSDSDTGPPVLPPVGTTLANLPETGGIQDVSRYFTTVPGDITVLVGSDVEAIPEPATWVMMLLGVGLTGGLLRNRARIASSAS